jgi:hypothetical protein
MPSNEMRCNGWNEMYYVVRYCTIVCQCITFIIYFLTALVSSAINPMMPDHVTASRLSEVQL